MHQPAPQQRRISADVRLSGGVRLSAIFPPEAVGAAELTFFAAIVPDCIRFDASYQNPEGETLMVLANLYYPNPEDAYFAFEQEG